MIMVIQVQDHILKEHLQRLNKAVQAIVILDLAQRCHRVEIELVNHFSLIRSHLQGRDNISQFLTRLEKEILLINSQKEQRVVVSEM